LEKRERAKREPPELRVLAQRHARAALKALVEIMKQGSSEAARIAAAEKILDRAHGKVGVESESVVEASHAELVEKAVAKRNGNAGG
jgi:hypothetical protein